MPRGLVAALVALALSAVPPAALAAAKPKGNADRVDGYNTTRASRPNAIPVLDSRGKLPLSMLPLGGIGAPGKDGLPGRDGAPGLPGAPGAVGDPGKDAPPLSGECTVLQAIRAIAATGAVTCGDVVGEVVAGTNLSVVKNGSSRTVALAPTIAVTQLNASATDRTPLAVSATGDNLTAATILTEGENTTGLSITSVGDQTTPLRVSNNSGPGTAAIFEGPIQAGRTVIQGGPSSGASDIQPGLVVNGGAGRTAIHGAAASNQRGVAGTASGASGVGLYGQVSGAGATGLQVVLMNGATQAAALSGNVSVSGNLSVGGTLTKGGGTFKIDHPLDPANKYLSHSFVESPDMMNVYNGNVRTDARGYATVELPAYFGALNRDFRYQLTPLNSFARATVARRITDNRFVIRTERPHITVSWQVTGIRHDTYARSRPVVVEEPKTGADRGRYLHPKLFGQPVSRQIGG